MINLDNIKPIDQQNIEEKTTEVIRNLILDGQLNPGTHVTEMSLSKTLKYERLLVHKPNKGMFVIELTAKDVWEIYTLRNELETLATKLVIQQMSDSIKEIMEKILHKMKVAAEEENLEESHRLDWIFHNPLSFF